MTTDFLLTPTPFQEAADFLKSKPVMTRRVFDQLLPELRARAFTVAGLTAADDLRTVRDAIAALPQGANWKDVKEQVAGVLLTETAEDSTAALKHAELVLRMQGFMAYSAAQYNLAQETRDELPFLMYNAMEDDRVRPEHAALDGLVLPVNDPFWQTHTPPWDWGCRCWLTQVSSADYARIKSGKGYGRVLGPAEHKRLNLTGELDDGAGHVITITTPAQRAAQNGEDPKLAWHWNPGDLRIPLDALHARYGADPETWHSFQDFAENNELIFGNLRHSLWDEMLDPERAKARAEVLAYGSKTGGEMAVAINYETGARVGFAVSAPGNKYEVDTSKLVATARSQKIKISLAHNHLSGNTFSPADISNLANPEVVEVLAHTQWARYRMARLVDMKPENAKRFSALMKQWTGDLKSGKKSWEEWVKYLQGSTIRGVMKYEAILVN